MPVAAASFPLLDSSIFGIFHPIGFSTAVSVELSTSISSGIAEFLKKFDDASYNEKGKRLRFYCPLRFTNILLLYLSAKKECRE